jgi:hypothetical protein
MNKKMSIVFLLVLVSLSVSACSCSKSDNADADQPPVVAEADKAPVTPPVAPAAVKPTPYEDEVVDSKVEGAATFDLIKSKSPCKMKSDCSFTKYHNAPKSADECKCVAGCTPYVVNVTERDLRKAANEKFCSASDWYGPDCPAPPCSFMDFDTFRCVDGVCEGQAAGRN